MGRRPGSLNKKTLERMELEEIKANSIPTNVNDSIRNTVIRVIDGEEVRIRAEYKEEVLDGVARYYLNKFEELPSDNNEYIILRKKN